MVFQKSLGLSIYALFVELSRRSAPMPASEEYSEQVNKQWTILDYGCLVNICLGITQGLGTVFDPR